MALRVRFQHDPGATLKYALERLSDGLQYDFGDGTFKLSPTIALGALTEGTGDFQGEYRAGLDPTPIDLFPNGEYVVSIHDVNLSNRVIDLLSVTMFAGDDAPAPPNAVALTSDDIATLAAQVIAGLPAGSSAAEIAVAVGNINIDGYKLYQALALIQAERTGDLTKDLNGTLTHHGPGGEIRLITTPTPTRRNPTRLPPA